MTQTSSGPVCHSGLWFSKLNLSGVTALRPWAVLVIVAGLCIGGAQAMQSFSPPPEALMTNSMGMKFVRIEPRTFEMGRLNPADNLDAGYEFVVDGGDWDTTPQPECFLFAGWMLRLPPSVAELLRRTGRFSMTNAPNHV